MTLEDGEDLDHSRGETFRREGGAEILELDQVKLGKYQGWRKHYYLPPQIFRPSAIPDYE